MMSFPGASISRFSTLLSLTFLVTTGLLWSQGKTSKPAAAKTPAASPPAPVLSAKEENAKVLSEFELTAEQKARLATVLPRSFPKLQRRAVFHVMVLGDGVAAVDGFGLEAGNILDGYPAQFMDILAAQFFYTGGVRVIGASKRQPAKRFELEGPEITLQSFAGRGRLAVEGQLAWGAYQKSPVPDLVILGFGATETATGDEASAFGTALLALTRKIQAAGSDVIITAPTLSVAEPVEVSLAASRVYASEARNVATLTNSVFFDLGDLATLTRLESLPTDAPLPPEEIFEQIVSSYGHAYDWPDGNDGALPNPALHERLSRRMFRTLLDGEPTTTWTARSATAAFTTADEFKLTFTLQNNDKDKPLRLVALPLVPRRWLPQEAEPEVIIKPGKVRKLEVVYQRNNAAGNIRWNAFPSSDSRLHLPIFVSDGRTARIEDLGASVQPVALNWKPQTLFGKEGTFTIPHSVINFTAAAIASAEWTATLGERKLTGKVDLPVGTPTSLPLTFDLPKDGTTFTEPLIVTMLVNNVLLRWERSVQATRNAGLKQELSLIAKQQEKAGPAPKVRCEADASALYLTVDLGDLALEDDEAGTAVIASLSLDARSFEQRLGPGAIEPIRYRLGVADGYGETSRVAPWAFGNGYGATFDSNALPIRLQSMANGVRRISLVVPRSFLYLHDFTPGNGNSHLGLNLHLQFFRQAIEGVSPAGFPETLHYAITHNPLPASSAESLVVLELADKPTQRWTITHW